MKLTTALIIGFAITCATCTGTKENRVFEWQNLISADGLTGWEKNGNFTAEVSEDILLLRGGQEDGWMIYEKEFEDFILEADVFIDANNSAGIAFRYPKKGDPTFSGYKVNIDYNPNQQNPTGSIFNVARGKLLKSLMSDDWNRIAIEARGDHLKVMINDTLVAETHDRRSDEGHIGLEVKRSSASRYKNLRIKELDETENLGPQLEDYMRNYDKRALEPMIIKNNLDDWSQVGEASWTIDDGIIHGYSNEKGGFLVHKDACQNFYLRLKFKIAHEHNSGIFIRHTPEDTNEVTTDNAIECNIYDHDGFLHEFSTGAIVPYARAWSKMIDYNDWNDMEIFAFEDQIIMYVNGRKSSEAHLPQAFNKKGNICIQGGIQVFNGNLPSDIYIRDMFLKNFDGIPYVGY